MPDWISKFFDSLKLSPRYVGMVSVFCAIILFTPAEYISALGVEQLQKDYRPWFGIAFILCCSVLSIHCLLFFRRKVYQKITIRNLCKRLHQLTEGEKAVLRGYIDHQTRTQDFEITNGVVIQLQSEHVILRASNNGNIITGFPYNIQPWAWEYLNENPELLK